MKTKIACAYFSTRPELGFGHFREWSPAVAAAYDRQRGCVDDVIQSLTFSSPRPLAVIDRGYSGPSASRLAAFLRLPVGPEIKNTAPLIAVTV